MESKVQLQTTQRFVHRPIQIVLVRANGPLFYGVAAASLLEAVAPLYAQRLIHLVHADKALTGWVENEWLPRKARHAQALQDYIETTWPEFDWLSAYEQYRACAEANGGLGPRRASPARELLARCTAAAQSGVFYRCLARWADDPKLRDLARDMAQDEALSFAHFRAAYERQGKVERVGFAAEWRAALGCVRTARDVHVPLAFRAINAQCGANVPFPVLRHGEFVKRMRAVIERNSVLGTPERLLFSPWKNRARILRVEVKPHRHPEWFKPLFTTAAEPGPGLAAARACR